MRSTRDNVSKDLEEMLKECGLDVKRHAALMMKLVSYIVRRDQLVFNRGHQVGKAAAEKEAA